MDSKINLNDIFEAINEINRKPKKKTIERSIIKSSIPKLNQDLSIPPDVDKLIIEAEKYKKTKTESTQTKSFEDKLILEEKDKTIILTNEVVDNAESVNYKITQLNYKVKDLEEIKKKLQSKIIDLEKRNNLSSDISNDLTNPIVSKNFINSTKKNLKFIYNQVEKQKKLFLNLKNYSVKIERDSTLYKENYERLIIENNELKTRLKITKEQIVKYEKDKKDLLSALDQLNEILSKSNIVGKISPQNPSTENIKKKETKIETLD